jgi:EmrB/QacA subfamily drug resistance transporter
MSVRTPTATSGLPLGSPAGRWLLVASILGSALAGIDATVVNVALPAIGDSLDADFATLQWTVSAYALTLAAFILLGGVLGDRFGRRRVFVIGVVWFAVASLLCGAAPNAELLVAARALQGVGAALLTPGSLAMIQASIAPEDRGRAIGAWSGLGGVATAIGPFLGGWLVQTLSWRWVFLVNVPLAVVVVLLAVRHVPESCDPGADGPVDLAGAALGAVALAGATWALISAGESGATPAVLVAAVVGLVAGTAFVLVERRARAPMLPLGAFRDSQFRAANLVTFVVYGGFGAVFFLLVVQLQVVSGFSPVAAGTALLPVTAVMLLLSSRSGALAARLGPRRQMAAGPVVCAAGVLLMLRLGPDASYLLDVLPAVVVLGLGLVTMVSPLTATALAAAPPEHAGMASGVNNAVARTAGLLAVAVVPAVAGLSGRAYDDPVAFDAGFATALWVSAATLVVGGVLAALTVRDDVLAVETGDRQLTFCAGVSGPPLATRVGADGRPDCDPVPLVTTTLEDPMPCTHLTDATPPIPLSDGCAECLETGQTWVHLRLCQECGHVGCCDSSPGRHATAHAREDEHPVIRSFEPGEEWFYCYVDDVALEVPDAPPAPSHH